MAIQVIQSPGQYVFTGNPVVFQLRSDTEDYMHVAITFEGRTHQASYYPYKQGNEYRVKIDISDYLRSDSDFSYAESGNDIVSEIQGFSIPFQVKIEDYVFNGIALRGGISRQAIGRLEENGYDIFTYRLSSFFDNFLFTTRTHGREIELRETELFPFVFIHPGLPIYFKADTGEEIISNAKTAGKFCSMDVRKLLEQFSAGAKRIEVCPNGEYSFHFTILPGQRSEERYGLRFRNSLGAFEVLEVTGKAKQTPEFSEESLYETLREYDFYEQRRSRVKRSANLEIETGYKKQNELPFIMDMLQSDEIYFIYPDGESFRCHVTSENAGWRNRITEPTSIQLKIRPAVKEEFFTPKIDFSEDFDRIFVETFDEIFN